MLLTPRIYSSSQTPDQGLIFPDSEDHLQFRSLKGWCTEPVNARRAEGMLLLHQAGSVRVGEAVRYTLTYTPEADPIQPIPKKLYLKVKNTSAIPLRAAYLRGPYTLYTACYPSGFDPNHKYEAREAGGTPQYEPYLKAGGNWDAVIPVPQHLRQTLQEHPTESQRSVTWVIEIVSQVIFSHAAVVHFELIVGRDEKSISLLSAGGMSTSNLPRPAQLHEHWSDTPRGEQVLARKGVYSQSIRLLVDDTVSLWNTPAFPSFDEEIGKKEAQEDRNRIPETEESRKPKDTPGNKTKKEKVHLVLITHGLHSNLGADMLYLKESIDSCAKKAREQLKKNRKPPAPRNNHSEASDISQRTNGHEENHDSQDAESDEEEVLVRGFSGNAVRTERGIQYLGKRLAKYVLLMTYPDQPYFPLKDSKPKSGKGPLEELTRSSGVSDDPNDTKDQGYSVTSISFVGHSLGGLIQTYAIAYIHKYSPQFFEKIRPVNFIALATPFLGLSNENPMYIRFALDLGLVGRTGQDLGLSWTAPKVRGGWGAILGGKGDSGKSQANSDPGSKPLLRILPCGPAHEVLKKFQRRTIYSNVVNDGIVPLRTSCLLFLDWKRLERVEKATRGNGIVGTMAEWGWAELTGANSKSPVTRSSPEIAWSESSEERDGVHHDGITRPASSHHGGVTGPASPKSAPQSPIHTQLLEQTRQPEPLSIVGETSSQASSPQSPSGPLYSFLSLFQPKATKPPHGHKQPKIYKRSQTLGIDDCTIESSSTKPKPHHPKPPVHDSSYNESRLHTPPKTSLFESASDLLMPPLPPIEFITDPASRPQTIFHDRIYRPEDIPPPAPVKRRTFTFGPSNKDPKAKNQSPTSNQPQHSNESQGGLKVEEKIARAYHRDLSWRKVLVRLEPDAHNNIIVRRMFTNAYGWPVIKHLVDTHFGYDAVVNPDDELDEGKGKAADSGDKVKGQPDTFPEECDITDELRKSGYHDEVLSPAENPSSTSKAGRGQVEGVTHRLCAVDISSNVSTASACDSAGWYGDDFDNEDGESEFGEESGFGDHIIRSVR